VQELARGQHREVRVLLGGLLEVLRRAGEQQAVERPARVGRQGRGVGVRQVGLDGTDPAARQRLGAERLRPPAGRVTEVAVEEADHRVGDVVLLRVGFERDRVDVLAHERQREVADHLRAGRHLDDVAEHPVGGGVHVLDRLEPVTQAQRDRLLAQVGELPPGDLVGVDAAGRARQARLELPVQHPDRLEVRLQILGRGQGQPRGARGVVGRGDERRHRHLRRGAGPRRGRHVHGVHAGVDGREQRAQLAAGGVVGVQVHRQVEPVAQRTHQHGRRGRAQQPRHVLDRQDVRPGLDELLGQPQVVVERVQVLPGRGHVARVAQRGLGHGVVGLEDRLDRGADLVDVVEGVEDAEDVDACARGLGDEGVGHGERVGRVADGVAAAEQHLDRQVGHQLVQGREPGPRVLLEEAEGHVVGGAAPRLDREQLGQGAGDPRRHVHQVAGAHARGEQGLVGVPERGVGDRHRLLLAQGAGEPLGAEFEQPLAGAGRRLGPEIHRGQLRAGDDGRPRLAERLVDRAFGEELQQLGRPVGRLVRAQQLGALVDERRRGPPGEEVRVCEDAAQEADVRADPTDAELGQRALGTADCRGEIAATAGQLDHHRVEVRADLGAGEHGAAVQPDARAARRPVHAHLAGVGAEPVGRVLGGDATLQGSATDVDRILGEAEVGERLTRGDAHLGGDQVDVGDLLGDRVLHLDARVHLDEHVAAVLAEQELDRPGVGVADVPGEADGVRADLIAQCGVEVGGGCQLDHLLVAALHGAVTLVEVDHVAGGVRQDLHLDVPGLVDGLLQVDPRVAERGVRLAHGLLQRGGQPGGVVDEAHAPTATAGHGLHEDGEADLRGGGHQRLRFVGRLGAPQHRQPRLADRGDRGRLVAGEVEHLGGRPDERDALLATTASQAGVLAQEAVTGVDRVRLGLLRRAHDPLDVEVGAHRVAALADLIALVRLQPILGQAILVGEDGDGLDAELGAGSP